MALTDNILLHLNLADNAASTTVVAQVGSNGTLLGGDNTSVKSTTGPNANIAAAFDLNGSDDAVDISANSISFASASAFSVRALVKFDQAVGQLLGLSSSANSRISKSTDTELRVVGGSGTIRAYAVPSLGTTNWHDIVVTRTTGNATRLWCDGTESSSGSQSLAEAFAPNRIGSASTFFHDGKLAAATVWSRELSSAEVAELYNGGSWKAYPWAGGNLAAANYYRQLQGAGGVVSV